jgi:hypothetical protein
MASCEASIVLHLIAVRSLRLRTNMQVVSDYLCTIALVSKAEGIIARRGPGCKIGKFGGCCVWIAFIVTYHFYLGIVARRSFNDDDFTRYSKDSMLRLGGGSVGVPSRYGRRAGCIRFITGGWGCLKFQKCCLQFGPGWCRCRMCRCL